MHENEPLMIADSIAKLLPTIAAILGSIVAGFIGWLLYRKNRFAEACRDFRRKMLTELEGLYPIPTNWPDDIDGYLRSKFPRLQATVAEFRSFMPRRRRKSFDLAWKNYRLGEDGREIDQQYYWQYMPNMITSVINGKAITKDNTNTYQDNFRRNVEEILKFARET